VAGFSPWRDAAGSKSPPDTHLAVDRTNVLAFCQHVFLRSPLAANLQLLHNLGEPVDFRVGADFVGSRCVQSVHLLEIAGAAGGAVQKRL
jgi:hypothetical protein